jgi:hypothetical protein
VVTGRGNRSGQASDRERLAGAIRDRTRQGPLPQTSVVRVGLELRLSKARARTLVGELLEQGELVDLAPRLAREHKIIHRENVPEQDLRLEGESQHAAHSALGRTAEVRSRSDGTGRLFIRNIGLRPLSAVTVSLEDGTAPLVSCQALVVGECAELDGGALARMLREMLTPGDRHAQQVAVLSRLAENELEPNPRRRIKTRRLVLTHRTGDRELAATLDLSFDVRENRWISYRSPRDSIPRVLR